MRRDEGDQGRAGPPRAPFERLRDRPRTGPGGPAGDRGGPADAERAAGDLAELFRQAAAHPPPALPEPALSRIWWGFAAAPGGRRRRLGIGGAIGSALLLASGAVVAARGGVLPLRLLGLGGAEEAPPAAELRPRAPRRSPRAEAPKPPAPEAPPPAGAEAAIEAPTAPAAAPAPAPAAARPTPAPRRVALVDRHAPPPRRAAPAPAAPAPTIAPREVPVDPPRTPTPAPAPRAPASAVGAGALPARPEPLHAPIRATAPPALGAPAAPSAVAAETAILRRALLKLRRERDPAGALRELDEHARRFPQAIAREEAAHARVDALLLLGRNADALGVLDTLSLGAEARAVELRLLRAELRGKTSCARALPDFDAVVAQAGPPTLAERALYGRATCRLRAGDEAGARRDLAEYVRRFPGGRFASLARARMQP